MAELPISLDNVVKCPEVSPSLTSAKENYPQLLQGTKLWVQNSLTTFSNHFLNHFSNHFSNHFPSHFSNHFSNHFSTPSPTSIDLFYSSYTSETSKLIWAG
jgi:hypothetical protein